LWSSLNGPEQELPVGRWNKRRVVVVVIAGVLASVGIAGLALIPRGDELRNILIQEVRQRFGARVAIASASWQLLPVPAVTVRDVSTDQKQPITIRRLFMVLDVGRTLLQREISLARLEVDGAVIPAVSLVALSSSPGPPTAVPASVNPDRLPVAHVRFRGVTWVFRTGVSLPVEGEIDFDRHWWPGFAQVRRAAFTPAARLTLVREGDADRWRARVALGTGTAHGTLVLSTRDDGILVLGGTLEPRDIEAVSAGASLNRRSPIRGKANGRTTVSARGRTGADLARSLLLRTKFRVAPATVLRLDLDKAIHSLGLEHAGQTALQSLTGTMDVQNTAEGALLRFTGVEAQAESFSATGEGTVLNRRINAHGTLDLVHGLIGVPFTIRGTTQKPRISVLGGKSPAVPAPPVARDER
jgi:hypothetical protein